MLYRQKAKYDFAKRNLGLFQEQFQNVGKNAYIVSGFVVVNDVNYYEQYF